jgi:hypothetical protein
LYYNQEDNILAIPSFNQHTVHFIHIVQTGMNDSQSDEQIEFYIYPNPTTEEVTINYSSNGSHPVRSEIFNNTGARLIYSFEEPSHPGMNTVNLNLSNLSSGIYIIRLQDGHRSNAKKLVIK